MKRQNFQRNDPVYEYCTVRDLCVITRNGIVVVSFSPTIQKGYTLLSASYSDRLYTRVFVNKRYSDRYSVTLAKRFMNDIIEEKIPYGYSEL